MSSEEAIEALDAIKHLDPEDAHADADRILLEVVDPEVADAYARLVNRSRWWAFA